MVGGMCFILMSFCDIFVKDNVVYKNKYKILIDSKDVSNWCRALNCKGIVLNGMTAYLYNVDSKLVNKLLNKENYKCLQIM